ncbi:jg13014 [Pararge aegeria aegeria]|uniref:Jg13014 protein n=1 Tax=Pararge aegeria aegeria TaxID=348720 RepID=A0A8S4SMH2_9NEOP|nr:jg13014 [Pararge aegeria aegeria]
MNNILYGLKGDKEREMGYTPLSMMDRRRSVNQPAEQIQFLSVVVLPCLLLLQNIFPNTSPLIDNCRYTLLLILSKLLINNTTTLHTSLSSPKVSVACVKGTKMTDE